MSIVLDTGTYVNRHQIAYSPCPTLVFFTGKGPEVKHHFKPATWSLRERRKMVYEANLTCLHISHLVLSNNYSWIFIITIDASALRQDIKAEIAQGYLLPCWRDSKCCWEIVVILWLLCWILVLSQD